MTKTLTVSTLHRYILRSLTMQDERLPVHDLPGVLAITSLDWFEKQLAGPLSNLKFKKDNSIFGGYWVDKEGVAYLLTLSNEVESVSVAVNTALALGVSRAPNIILNFSEEGGLIRSKEHRKELLDWVEKRMENKDLAGMAWHEVNWLRKYLGKARVISL